MPLALATISRVAAAHLSSHHGVTSIQFCILVFVSSVYLNKHTFCNNTDPYITLPITF